MPTSIIVWHAPLFVKRSERFKALARGAKEKGKTGHTRCACVYPNGIYWQLLRKNPVMVNDTYNRTRMEIWHRPPIKPEYWAARDYYPL